MHSNCDIHTAEADSEHAYFVRAPSPGHSSLDYKFGDKRWNFFPLDQWMLQINGQNRYNICDKGHECGTDSDFCGWKEITDNSAKEKNRLYWVRCRMSPAGCALVQFEERPWLCCTEVLSSAQGSARSFSPKAQFSTLCVSFLFPPIRERNTVTILLCKLVCSSQEFPDGQVTQEQFQDLYSQQFPSGDASKVTNPFPRLAHGKATD